MKDSQSSDKRLKVVKPGARPLAEGKADATGARVRAIRKAKGWSLARLSKASGIPQSTLSKFETGTLSLPLDRVFHVSDALGVTVMELFDPRGADSDGQAFGRRSVTRADEGRFLESGSYDCRWLFPDLLQKQMFPVVEEVRARNLSEFGPLLKHSGEEFSLVLEGTVEVVTDIYEPVILETFDGIYIDSRMGHAYLNAGDGIARILNVSTGSPAIPTDDN